MKNPLKIKEFQCTPFHHIDTRHQSSTAQNPTQSVCPFCHGHLLYHTYTHNTPSTLHGPKRMRLRTFSSHTFPNRDRELCVCVFWHLPCLWPCHARTRHNISLHHNFCFVVCVIISDISISIPKLNVSIGNEVRPVESEVDRVVESLLVESESACVRAQIWSNEFRSVWCSRLVRGVDVVSPKRQRCMGWVGGKWVGV